MSIKVWTCVIRRRIMIYRLPSDSLHHRIIRADVCLSSLSFLRLSLRLILFRTCLFLLLSRLELHSHPALLNFNVGEVSWGALKPALWLRLKCPSLSGP